MFTYSKCPFITSIKERLSSDFMAILKLKLEKFLLILIFDYFINPEYFSLIFEYFCLNIYRKLVSVNFSLFV